MPPSAVPVVADAFYPFTGFEAGTTAGQRRLEFGGPARTALDATADLAAIHARVQRAGAKLLLTGDHRQLAAVGASYASNHNAANVTSSASMNVGLRNAWAPTIPAATPSVTVM